MLDEQLATLISVFLICVLPLAALSIAFLVHDLAVIAARARATRRRLAMCVSDSALSPDDAGLVSAMAASLPENLDISDACTVMLWLHADRFQIADIVRLVPHVIAKARDYRNFFGLGAPRGAARRELTP